MDAGLRVLSLDGGGIRGLIILEILEAIEKEAGQSIRELFDWVGGTSTGGIIALAIAQGKSVSTIRQMYHQLKGKVFKGSPPYESAPFETLLKKEFGEKSLMTDIKDTKVVVTSVLGDHEPWKLHLFRSYINPNGPGDGDTFLPVKPPNEQYIWEVARSTSAAPYYFHPYNQYLDGGLMSNNPSLDILTEIRKYNKRSKPPPKVGVVVSIGCGYVDYKRIDVPDLEMPNIIFHPFKFLTSLRKAWTFLKSLLNQVTISNGQPTQRAEAWCVMNEVPFFRSNPLLSEDVPLDCVKEELLAKMLQDTKSHIENNMVHIEEVAKLLNRQTTNEERVKILEMQKGNSRVAMLMSGRVNK